MMRAAQYDTFSDDITTLKVRDVAKPEPKDGQVLVKVKASAVNPIDVKVMAGDLKELWKYSLPFTLGYDLSGVVEAIGPGDTNGICVGDEVWGVNWGQMNHDDDAVIGGTMAEYIAIPSHKISKKPSGLSHSQAAALALVGTTAYQSVETSTVKKGDRVLVLGGSTAVGAIVTQLAKLRGAEVIVTASSRTKSYVEGFNPDVIIDYTQQDWSKELMSHPVNHVIDCVGETDGFARSDGVVTKGGTFLSIAAFDAGFDPTAHQPRYQWASFFCLSNSQNVQDKLASLVVDGTLTLVIDCETPFSQEGVIEVMTKQKNGKSLGKNVLTF